MVERVAGRPTRASRMVVEESPVRERRPTTGGARPLQAHRRRHGAGPLDAAGDLVANGWPRPVVTGPDSPVTEFIPALRTV